MKIIDISHWNTINDWEQVANNVDGIIIKCGGTDSTNGLPYTDRLFEYNYKQCKSHNIPVGAYWFVGKSCLGNARGVENALAMVKRLEGKQFDLPVFIDFETSTPSAKRDNTDAVISFCNTLEGKGWFVGIYASDIYGFKDRLYADELKSFCWWVARYSTNEPTHDYALWQYTSSGSIPGVVGRVDISKDKNDIMTQYRKLIIDRGFNGYSKENTRSKTQVEIYTDTYNKILEQPGDTFADKLEGVING